MAAYTQKLQATISAAVESWQTWFNSLIVQLVQHVRFFLGPSDVQPVAICLIWCRVVRSRDFSASCYATTLIDSSRRQYVTWGTVTKTQEGRDQGQGHLDRTKTETAHFLQIFQTAHNRQDERTINIRLDSHHTERSMESRDSDHFVAKVLTVWTSAMTDSETVMEDLLKILTETPHCVERPMRTISDRLYVDQRRSLNQGCYVCGEYGCHLNNHKQTTPQAHQEQTPRQGTPVNQTPTPMSLQGKRTAERGRASDLQLKFLSDGIKYPRNDIPL